MPAQATWNSYINKELGFSFMMPREIKASVGTFRGAVAGPRHTILDRSSEDNIETHRLPLKAGVSNGDRKCRKCLAYSAGLAGVCGLVVVATNANAQIESGPWKPDKPTFTVQQKGCGEVSNLTFKLTCSDATASSAPSEGYARSDPLQ